MNQGQISEDGMWRWDGERWVPNTATQRPPPEPRRKSHTRRNVGIGCGSALAALIALIVILVAVNGAGSRTSTTGGTPSPQPTPACSPAPCATKNNVTVTVANLNRNVPAAQFSTPQPGNHYVSMTVAFKNAADREFHANPFNFVLKDQTGVKHSRAFAYGVPGCESWQAVNLTKGASLPPQPLCFEAGGHPNGPLTLVWTFTGDVNIPLQ